MARFFISLTEQHDLRLVLLALVMAYFGAFTSISVFARSAAASGRLRAVWFAAAALIAGFEVWATNFTAMMAYRAHPVDGYDLALTALSVVAAVVMIGGGFAVAFGRGLRPGIIGGALTGLGIAAMHALGMAAMIVPHEVTYEPALAGVAVLAGVSFAIAGTLVSRARLAIGNRLLGAAFFAVAILSLHFISMAAIVVPPATRVHDAGAATVMDWLAAAVAMVGLSTMAVGLAGSVIDQRLATRAESEARRLRLHVTELESTKAELVRTSKELASALHAADVAARAKAQFLAAMGHELRTPLNAVIGFSEILEKEMFGPLGSAQYRDYAASIHKSGERLLVIINEILDFTKLDAKRMDLEEEGVDLGDMLDGLAQAARPEMAKIGIDLHIGLDSRLPLVQADPRRLRQILSKLLANAIKFTPAGGMVSVEARMAPDGLAIAIADTGIGMSPEELQRALEPFGQADARLERKYEGAGLGLPIARGLVERHGGRLNIESRPGAGTTVTVLLPADRLVMKVDAAA
jgi:signal transduction histidine kinase